jgi:hypothetical protein
LLFPSGSEAFPRCARTFIETSNHTGKIPIITPEVISDGAHDGIQMGTPGATAAARRRFGIDDGATTNAVANLYYCQPLLPILIVVSRKDECCILNSFAALKDTPGIPGLDIPGLDIVSNMLRSSMCFQFSAR